MEGLGWDLYVLEGTMEAGGREGGRYVIYILGRW